MLFDTHAHLLDEQFDEDRDNIIEELPALGIRGYIECATDQDTSIRAAGLAKEYYAAFASVGVHPHSASEWDRAAEAVITGLLKEKDVVAVGEIGLDYHYDFSPRDVQKRVFREQMEIARRHNMPVVIHSREATEDTLAILREFPDVTGVMHCFSGSVDTLHQILDMGYYAAFGGATTFRNAKKPLDALRETPADRLLLETDSPYMTPVPYRGKRNTPFNVRLVAKKAAEIRGVSEEEIADVTTKNAAKVFRLSLD